MLAELSQTVYTVTAPTKGKVEIALRAVVSDIAKISIPAASDV